MPEGLGSALYGVGMGIVNNSLGIINGKISRRENYQYGEMAANNADARTRALYNDLYSIPAQMQQLKNAGLSPSLFYGQAGGISGQTGAQGTGASGIQNPTFGIDPLTFAQIKNINADTENKQAENQLIKKETEVTQEKVNNFIADTKNKYLQGENQVLQNMFAQIDYAIKANYSEEYMQKNLEILGYNAKNLAQELRKKTVDGNVAEATEKTIIEYYQKRTIALGKDILLKGIEGDKMREQINDLMSQESTREKLALLKEDELTNWLTVELEKIGISKGELNNDNWRVRLEMIKQAWQMAKDLAIIAP